MNFSAALFLILFVSVPSQAAEGIGQSAPVCRSQESLEGLFDYHDYCQSSPLGAMVGGAALETIHDSELAASDLVNPVPRSAFNLPTQGEWTGDEKGRPADPVTIYIHGTLEEIYRRLRADQWKKANLPGIKSDLKYLSVAAHQELDNGEAILGKHVDSEIEKVEEREGMTARPVLPEKAPGLPGVNHMPMSIQTLNSATMIAGFERDNRVFGGRDHLRVFDTGGADFNGRPVFAIAASRDSKITVLENGHAIWHAVEPNVSGERDKVLLSLTKDGAAVARNEKRDWQGNSTYGEVVADGLIFDLTFLDP